MVLLILGIDIACFFGVTKMASGQEYFLFFLKFQLQVRVNRHLKFYILQKPVYTTSSNLVSY